MENTRQLIFYLMALIAISTHAQNFSNVLVNDISTGYQDTDGGTAIALYNDNIYVLWQEQESLYSYFVSKSTDGGETFGTGAQVNTTDFNLYGSLCIGSSGSVLISYSGINDAQDAIEGVYFTKSSNEAATFSAPVTISSTGILPQIAAYGNNVYILYILKENATDYGYYFTYSTDGGSTFATSYEITDATFTSLKKDNPHSLGVDGSGNIYAVWNDGRNGTDNSDIFLDKSSDNGLSFGTDLQINASATKIRTGPRIAISGNNLYIAWQQADDDSGSNRKVIFSKSNNGGASFGTEMDMGNTYNGIPAIACDNSGTIYLVYPYYGTPENFPNASQNGLYYQKSTDGGSNFSDRYLISERNANVKYPAMAIKPDNTAYLAWTDSRSGDNDIYFSKTHPIDPVAPAAGDGSSGDPYQISTLNQLYWITAENARSAKHYIQTTNIDASSVSNWFYGKGWPCMGYYHDGTDYLDFSGSYNGQNYSISNLFINRPSSEQIGLFGCSDGATLSNINVSNANITGLNYIGSLVGLYASTQVNNCSSSGTISGNNYVGGLVGANAYGSSISKSKSTATVTGNLAIGGLAGSNGTSTIAQSLASGNTTGVQYVGGLVGYNNGASILQSYASGTISASNTDAGGLVGSSSNSTITNSYSRGNVLRTTGSGIDFGSFTGRLYNTNTVEYSYATGSVSYTPDTNPTDKGFVGTSEGTPTFTNNFFNTQSTAQSTATGATGKTNSEMNTQTTFTDAGWDFIGESSNGDNNYWTMLSTFNDGYPYHPWEYNIWNGNDQWINTANWSNGILPTTNTNVIVESGMMEVYDDITLGSLTIKPTATVNVGEGKKISCRSTLIRSDATGTGKYVTDASGISATMEQYLVKDQWHYFSLPVSGPINANGTFNNIYVIGNTESTNAWNYLNSSNSLTAGAGYGIQYNLSTSSNDTTISISGTLNSGDITVQTQYTDHDTHGWNLIGNPFACTIDWTDGALLTNVDNAIYLWDPIAGSYDNFVVGTGSTGGQDQDIAPMQGFFVRANAPNGSVQFTSGIRKSRPSNFKSTEANSLLKLEVSDIENRKDATLVSINDQSTSLFDSNYDAYKLIATTSLTPQIYTQLEGIDYSINAMPESASNEYITLNILVKTTGIHHLKLLENTLNCENNTVSLFDLNSNLLANLNEENYSFNAEASELKTFFLELKSKLVSNPEIRSKNIVLYSEQNELVLENLNNVPSAIRIFDLTGHLVYNKKITAPNCRISVLASGIYLVNVMPEKGPIFNGKVVANF
ncbi:MAG: GLUG motif-containing protein [Prolixibacteraceae bacterium]